MLLPENGPKYGMKIAQANLLQNRDQKLTVQSYINSMNNILDSKIN